MKKVTSYARYALVIYNHCPNFGAFKSYHHTHAGLGVWTAVTSKESKMVTNRQRPQSVQQNNNKTNFTD